MKQMRTDYDLVARELLRALRGSRSQIAFARRLGYRSNPCTDWEHGRRFPNASEALRIAVRSGAEVDAAFAEFSPVTGPRAEGAWAVCDWLSGLRGSLSVLEVARRSGSSRHAIARWLTGENIPRLPEFLGLIDALTGRLHDWVFLLLELESVPSLAPIHRQVSAARRIAFEMPWSEAILRVMETEPYKALAAHSTAFVAHTLRAPEAAVETAIVALSDADIIRAAFPNPGPYAVVGSLLVDTRASAEDMRRVRRHWQEVSMNHVDAGSGDWFAYNVISASEADLERIEERLRAVYREIRSMVMHSQPSERAALLTLQLVRWS
jgi:transcriptional regulator with XRE-family HTH domain